MAATTPDLEPFVIRFFDALNARDWATVETMYAEDLRYTNPMSVGRTKAARMESLQGSVAVIPSMTAQIRRITTSGNRAIVETQATSDLTNAGYTPSGTSLAATGAHVRTHGCWVFDVEGGKIVDERMYFDMTPLFTGFRAFKGQ